MEFKSQICTTREQSERLLRLGLKKETADCALHYDYVGIDGEVHHMAYEIGHKCCGIPAWSLHRLLSMLPDDAPNLFWTLNNANISIEQEDGSDFFPHRNSMYDSIIDCIEFLIKEEWFNKDYLEEKL